LVASEDRIVINPFSKWRREDAPRSRHKDQRVLTTSEKAKLLGLNDERTPIWAIQLATGNRIGETLALTWDDLYLPEDENEHGSLHIYRAIHRRKKTDVANPDWLDYGSNYYLDKPKTKRSTREVILTPFVVQIFKDVRERQEAEAKRWSGDWFCNAVKGIAWSNPKRFVFTRFYGEPIVPDIAWDWMQTSAKKAGLGNITVHSLRHTMITDGISGGTPLEKISKMVGHSSVAFTADVYGHLTKEMSTEVAEAASRIIEQAMRFAKTPELQGVNNA